jgi:hypothetical protein
MQGKKDQGDGIGSGWFTAERRKQIINEIGKCDTAMDSPCISVSMILSVVHSMLLLKSNQGRKEKPRVKSNVESVRSRFWD